MSTLGPLLTLWMADFCPNSLPAPQVTLKALDRGPLRVGAARVQIQPPYPVVAAGYRPWREEVNASETPLYARALVVKVADVTFGWLTLETLTIPGEMALRLRQEASHWGFDSVWVSATHTHSSMGHYDEGLIEQVVGIGRHRQAAEDVLLTAGSQALQKALEQLTSAQMVELSAEIPSVYPRSGNVVDHRLHAWRFVTSSGQPKALAQVVMLAAHPTLVDRNPPRLSSDYPGLLADLEEKAGHGISLIVQGAVGNASVLDKSLNEFTAEVHTVLENAAKSPRVLGESLELGLTRVEFSLPSADTSRVLPWEFPRLGNNIACLDAPEKLTIESLQLGPFKIASVPGEPVYEVSNEWEKAFGYHRIIGLTHDYIGYIETENAVTAREGESQRQYFSKELASVISKALELAR